MNYDWRRLNWLEQYINKYGAIMLHDGSKSNFGCSGLGLRPGFLTRGLREAIDTAMAMEEPEAKVETKKEGLNPKGPRYL